MTYSNVFWVLKIFLYQLYIAHWSNLARLLARTKFLMSVWFAFAQLFIGWIGLSFVRLKLVLALKHLMRWIKIYYKQFLRDSLSYSNLSKLWLLHSLLFFRKSLEINWKWFECSWDIWNHNIPNHFICFSTVAPISIFNRHFLPWTLARQLH